MSGQGRYRSLWEHYYQDREAIIYVLDSADTSRAAVAKEELDYILRHEDVRSRAIPLLLLINKSDLVPLVDPGKFAELFELSRVTDRPWTVVSTNGRTGEGLNEGMEWLTEGIKAASN
eukprot:Clim_evm26s211 gene=Clim_evmTU26s211